MYIYAIPSVKQNVYIFPYVPYSYIASVLFLQREVRKEIKYINLAKYEGREKKETISLRIYFAYNFT